MPSREPLEEFDIDPAPIWPAEDTRLEPAFPAGLLWIEFEEADRLNPEPAHPSLEAALLVGFDESDPAEFERAQLRAEEPPPTPSQRAVAIGMAGSVGVHLLPVLFLLGWSSAPGELAAAMPVQLVLEQPAPEPPPEAPKPLPDRPASEDIGDPAKAMSAPAPVPPPRLQPGKPAQRLAAVVPPPPKAPRPAKPAIAAPPIPSPQPPPEPPGGGRIPGPEASRDEYLAYLVTLTRRHVDLLPLSVIAGRRGETSLSLLVLGDGTIARISIVQSSGYNDIDAKIEQIVAAVRRFPPLPQRFSGPNLELTLRFRFPDAVLGR